MKYHLTLLLAVAVGPLAGSAAATEGSDGPTDPEVIAAGLKSHHRALYIKTGWIRDPYIVVGPDDYYYLTGTTTNPAVQRTGLPGRTERADLQVVFSGMAHPSRTSRAAGGARRSSTPTDRLSHAKKRATQTWVTTRIQSTRKV